eukprot:6173288-Pleurochrysis_carterae.AAC.2
MPMAVESQPIQPYELGKRILAAESVDELFSIFARHGGLYSGINVSATWTRLAKLTRGPTLSLDEKLLTLALHSKSMVERGELNARALANVAYAVARCTGKARLYTTPLFSAIADASTPQAYAFKPQELANTVWAFAKAEHKSAELFDAMARECVNRVDDLNPQDIANVAWAFATAGRSSPELFEALATTATALTEHYNPQDLANTAWAFATAGYFPPYLFDEIASAATAGIDQFKPQELANMAWAFATGAHEAPSLFDAIAAAATASIQGFTPQGLSNTAWAFAKAGHASPPLFDALASACTAQMHRFIAQDVSNTAWAFATAGYGAPALFDALTLASTLPSRLDRFAPQHLINTAWAFAVVDRATPDALATKLLDCCSSDTWVAREAPRQLHQWLLWNREHGLEPPVPESLSDKCKAAFVATELSTSSLQLQVESALLSMGVSFRSEVITEIGYSIDIVVDKEDGGTVGIEVDGPCHFIGRYPNGNSLLKHRQLRNLEGWRLYSVPWWELREIKGSAERRRAYLSRILEHAARSRAIDAQRKSVHTQQSQQNT